MADEVHVPGSEEKANKTHTIAMCQVKSKLCDKPFNISQMKENIKKASVLGAELIVFPELFTTGYSMTVEEVKRLAEARDGETFREISECAKQHQMAVVYGYAEKDGESIFNSAMVIDKNGLCMGNYRKIHLFGEWEKKAFTQGNDPLVLDIAGIRIGILICYDYDFPEMVRLLALKEAKLMIVPTAIISKWDHDIRMVPPVRAYENSVFLAFVNHVGPQRDFHFSGGTCCVDPHGVELVRCWGQESLLTATIDPTECEKPEIKFLVDRRPEIYYKN